MHKHCEKFSFPCPSHQCNRRFSAYSSFKSHCFRDHVGKRHSNKRKVIGIDVPLQCSLNTCKQICSDVEQFIKHLKEHIRNGVKVNCPFDACDSSFIKLPSFCSHIARYHRVHKTQMMSACHIVDLNEDITDHDVDDDQNVHMEDTAESNVLDDDSDIQLYLKSLSLFYLKLQAKYLVPSSTIQHIITDIQDVHKLGQSYLTDKLIERITKHFDLPKSVFFFCFFLRR